MKIAGIGALLAGVAGAAQRPSREIRLVAHALPAGRNQLQVRFMLDVANHGAGTCRRRYVWRIE
jgi:hypothetical protein